jgi:hypothetical protein
MPSEMGVILLFAICKSSNVNVKLERWKTEGRSYNSIGVWGTAPFFIPSEFTILCGSTDSAVFRTDRRIRANEACTLVTTRSGSLPHIPSFLGWPSLVPGSL